MKKNIKGYLMILPLGIILIGIFGVALVTSLLQSFGYFPQINKYEFTIQYYQEVIARTDFQRAIIVSFHTALIASLLAVILGVLLAYLISQLGEKGKKFHKLLILPTYVPHIIAVSLIYMMFAQSGLISRCLFACNLIQESSDFISCIQDPFGIGIILVYVWKGMPFVIMTVYTIMSNINDTLSVAAKNLGATSKQVFWNIHLPLVMPTIISSFIILFAFSFGSFEVPYLIGATAPKPLPVLAYIEYNSSNIEQRIYASVINMIIVTIAFILLWIYTKITKMIEKSR